MQILRTEVSQARASTGEPVMRVLFCGEGGDCVTVDMAKGELGSEALMLDRARAILVQTATFGMAENAYDARSNGNFDEVTATAASDAKGNAVYVFECRDGESSRQIAPSRVASFEVAREEALRCAIDLLVDLEPGTDPLTGWLVRVRNESGEILCAIDVQEAEAARQIRQ